MIVGEEGGGLGRAFFLGGAEWSGVVRGVYGPLMIAGFVLISGGAVI